MAQNLNSNQTGSRTSNRGFASMDPNMQRKIASKGGEAVSQNREHMREIGRKGGANSHVNRRNNNDGKSGENSSSNNE